MFGYILPEKPEMKIKEYELFRAYYCGVCKSIGKRHGQFERLALNYDSTFLAILLSAAAGEIPAVRKEKCIAHPFKKRHMVRNSEILDYASDINILLAYYNLEDNSRDEGSKVAGAGAFLLKRAFKKIKRKNKDKCAIIEDRLNDLHRLEQEKCPSMDKAAEPFARLMEEVTAYVPLCSDENNGKVLRWMGYNLGKWIYILDAFDDMEDDAARKGYNPLLCQFGYEGGDMGEFKKSVREKVEFNLTYSLNQLAGALDLLDIKTNKGILENIIYMGMLRKTENILGTGSCGKFEQSI